LPPTPAVTKPTVAAAAHLHRRYPGHSLHSCPTNPCHRYHTLPWPCTAAMSTTATECIHAMHPRPVDILPLDASDPATTLAPIRARHVPLTWRCAPIPPLAGPMSPPFAGACCPCGQWRRPAACGPLGHHTQRRTRPHRRLRHQQDKHRQGVRAMESDPPSRALPITTTILCSSFPLPLWHWAMFSRTYPFPKTDDCVLDCTLVKSSLPTPLDPDNPCLPPSPDPQPGLSLILASMAKRSAAATRLTRSITSSP